MSTWTRRGGLGLKERRQISVNHKKGGLENRRGGVGGDGGGVGGGRRSEYRGGDYYEFIARAPSIRWE